MKICNKDLSTGSFCHYADSPQAVYCKCFEKKGHEGKCKCHCNRGKTEETDPGCYPDGAYGGGDGRH